MAANMADDVKFLSAEIHRQEARERKKRLRDDVPITPWCLQVALVISCMTNFTHDVAYSWLVCPKRKGAQIRRQMSKEEIVTYLDDKFLEADIDVLLSYGDGAACRLMRNVAPTALKFVSEFRMTEGILTRNVDHGAVVSARELVEQTNTFIAENDYESALPGRLYLPTDVRKARMRLTRYRKKWSVDVHGVVYTEKPISQMEKRTKATGPLRSPWSPVGHPD